VGDGADLVIRTLRGKGRGVFAGRRFAADEVLERAPVIVIPNEEWAQVSASVVASYCFTWGARDDAAIPLGRASLLNHSYTPNAYAQIHLREKVIEFLALRDIEAGEEITLNYNGDHADRTAMSFTVRP
jgi:SET domain-containing protein